MAADLHERLREGLARLAARPGCVSSLVEHPIDDPMLHQRWLDERRDLLPAALRAYYRSRNGVRLSWRLTGGDALAAGHLALPTLRAFLWGHAKPGDPADFAYLAWLPADPPEVAAQGKRLHVLDVCAQTGLAVGVDPRRPEDPPLARVSRDFYPLKLDISGYLATAADLAGLDGWQLLFADDRFADPQALAALARRLRDAGLDGALRRRRAPLNAAAAAALRAARRARASSEREAQTPPLPALPPADAAVIELGGSPLVLLPVPAGECRMIPPPAPGASREGAPERLVPVAAFRLQAAPVTQGQYAAVMEENPALFQGDPRRPVESVRWYNALAFCNRLSQHAGLRPAFYEDPRLKKLYRGGTRDVVYMDLAADGFRLPRDEEWEHACRAGTDTLYWCGDDGRDLGRCAWHDGNAGGTTHPVAQKAPNPWGLYDMHGNVAEWTLTPLTHAGYARPAGFVIEGSKAILSNPRSDHHAYWATRGGSWADRALRLASGCRGLQRPEARASAVGFRVALPAPRP